MSKLISSNGKLFGKINLLDFIVIVILLIAICGGIYKFAFLDNTLFIPEYTDGTIVIQATNLLHHEVEAIMQDDFLTVPNIQKIGKVVSVESAHKLENSSATDGKVYTTEHPLLYKVTITVKTDELSKRNENYYIGKNYKIIAGQSLDVSNGIFAFKASVVSVNEG